MAGKPQLGQHFLNDQRFLEMIAGVAAPAKVPLIVEIGPGRGALTRHLLGRADHVVAIEYDRGLAAELPSRCGDPANLSVVQADVLRCDLRQIVGEHSPAPAVIAGNLPYYITSPILRATFDASGVFERCAFLIQEEVADRVAAEQGSRDYALLSCLAQLNGTVRKEFSIPPEAFDPPPKVHSAVISIELDREPPQASLLRFLESCFRARRKTLRNNLGSLYPKERVSKDEKAGMRAQQLSLDELTAMWKRLSAG